MSDVIQYNLASSYIHSSVTRTSSVARLAARCATVQLPSKNGTCKQCWWLWFVSPRSYYCSPPMRHTGSIPESTYSAQSCLHPAVFRTSQMVSLQLLSFGAVLKEVTSFLISTVSGTTARRHTVLDFFYRLRCYTKRRKHATLTEVATMVSLHFPEATASKGDTCSRSGAWDQQGKSAKHRGVKANK